MERLEIIDKELKEFANTQAAKWLFKYIQAIHSQSVFITEAVVHMAQINDIANKSLDKLCDDFDQKELEGLRDYLKLSLANTEQFYTETIEPSQINHNRLFEIINNNLNTESFH